MAMLMHPGDQPGEVLIRLSLKTWQAFSWESETGECGFVYNLFYEIMALFSIA